MPYEYNPLLKDGLQKVSNGGGDIDERIAALQNAINELQSRLNDLKGLKITKVTATSQLSEIENNEIFEWQAETQTVDGVDYVNGYFYKKTIGQQTLPSGTTYFLYEQNYPTITKNGYVFTPGNYYHLDTITPANGSNFYSYSLYQWNGISRYYFVLPTGVNLQVGDLVWDNQDYTFVTVVSLDDNGKPTLSNGEYISASGKTGGLFVEIIECKNSDGTAFSFIKSNSGRLVVHYTLVNNVFTLIDWFYVYVVTRSTTTPQTIGVDTYTQTNTQPSSSYSLPIAAANVLGGIKVGSGLSIDANGVLSASGGGSSTPHIYRCYVLTTAPNYVTALSYIAFVFNNLLFINGLFNILDTPSGDFLRVVYNDDESDVFTIQFLESFSYDANFINVNDNNLMSNIGGFARTNAGSDTLQSDNGSFPVGMASFNVVIPIAITLQS